MKIRKQVDFWHICIKNGRFVACLVKSKVTENTDANDLGWVTSVLF
ncbi:MAG: hypothetical protein IJT72_02505 [Lachnospiraceae bacterium]|nr:hypothetical protein [Lachnospiraceae bacterium]